MTLLATISNFLVSDYADRTRELPSYRRLTPLPQSVCTIVLAASRIIFAIARDGALPFASWVSQVTPSGHPRNAGTLLGIFSAALLCVIIPSAAAFTSLLSAGVVPLMASYGLIALLRLIMTPNAFKNTKFPLGKARKWMYAVSAIFNAILFAVRGVSGCRCQCSMLEMHRFWSHRSPSLCLRSRSISWVSLF